MMFPLTALNAYAPVPKIGRSRQMRDLAVIIAASAVTAFTLYGCGGGHNEPAVKDAGADAAVSHPDRHAERQPQLRGRC